MTLSSKYRSYGIRRENNLSDVNDKIEALNNLLNNLPDIGSGENFISEDLDAIRGLSSTNVSPETFIQLASSAPTYTYVDNGQIRQDIIEPIIRIKDRFRGYRSITGVPGALGSGLGPRAFFIPSSNISNFTSTSTIDVDVDTNGVETNDEFWVLGETQIGGKIRTDFSDQFGGVLWEGNFYPNVQSTFQNFSFNTTGLYHVEFDRFSDGNWEVAKSIYAEQRVVTVDTNTTINTNAIPIQESDMLYVAVGDAINGDPDNRVEAINYETNFLVITNPITISQNDTISLSFESGTDNISAEYTIRTVVDKGEIPTIKMRFFWWYPVKISAPQTKIVLTNYSGSRLPFFRFSIDPPSSNPGENEIRTLLNDAVTPTQEELGEIGNSGNDYKDFRNRNVYNSLYTPKSSLAEVTLLNSTNITFESNNRFVEGTSADFIQTEVGNYIVPTNPADLGSVIPKNLRIKDVPSFDKANPVRIVNQILISDQTSYSVSIVDHNGLVDYFVGSSSNDIVTVNDTSNLKEDMICINASTTNTNFFRITEIVSATQFRTSSNLNITSEYVYVYANAGVIDRSKQVFCQGVFGQTLSANATSNILTLSSVDGVQLGQVVQFGDLIPLNTTVENITGNDVEISNNLTDTIISGSTIVFTPSGTTVNKESCVLPLDLSPPFVGVDRGLDANGNNISSTFSTEFNVKVTNLETENSTVNLVGSSPTYNSVLVISNGYKILADKI